MRYRVAKLLVCGTLFATLAAVGTAFADEGLPIVSTEAEAMGSSDFADSEDALADEASTFEADEPESEAVHEGGQEEGSSDSRGAVEPIECFQGSWEKSGSKWRYVVAGEVVKDVKAIIGGKVYFFDAEGWMCSGWKKHEGEWYYLGSADQGAAQAGWLKWGSAWYYLDPETKAMARGWHDLGSRYYFGEGEDDGMMAHGWRLIDGNWYYFGGADDGVVRVGWLWWGGAWRYLDENGAMRTGWLDLDGDVRYLDPTNDGVMATGWLNLDGEWYYLNPSNDGIMLTGWLWWGSAWYYLDPSQNGVMATGLLSVDGESYYCKDSGALCVREWVAVDATQPGSLSFANSSGQLILNAVRDESGRIVVTDEIVAMGWLEIDGLRFYIGGQDFEGQNLRFVKTGWVQDGACWYYLNDSGIMQTGWVWWTDAWYFLGSDGAMRTGWLLDGGYWYYLRGDGSMVAGTTLSIGGENHSFEGDGVWSVQRDIYRAAFLTGTTGYGRCAEWVSRVYLAAGWPYLNGDARDMYWGWCWSSNREDLAVGMTVGVPTSKVSALGRIYGHVGIYIGNGMVRHNVSGVLVTPLDEWIETYYVEGSSAPRWGFPSK